VTLQIIPKEDDRFLRVSLVAVRLGEGPLTEGTAGVQPARREQAFMPHSGYYPTPAPGGLRLDTSSSA